MSAYALGALVAYRPDHAGAECINGWHTAPHEIVGRMTREWLTRPAETWYTLMLVTGDGTYWMSRPITFVRPAQVRAWPHARCLHCGEGLPLAQRATPTPEACHECTVWWMHLQAQTATEDTP